MSNEVDIESVWFAALTTLSFIVFSALGIWLATAAFTWGIGWALGAWWTLFVLGGYFSLLNIGQEQGGWMILLYPFAILVLGIVFSIILGSGAVVTAGVYLTVGLISNTISFASWIGQHL